MNEDREEIATLSPNRNPTPVSQIRKRKNIINDDKVDNNKRIFDGSDKENVVNGSADRNHLTNKQYSILREFTGLAAEESKDDSDRNGLIYTANDASMEEEDDDNMQFEAGLILRVDMEDFMCHRKFTVELGRQVNFITGPNGSGKSAIVAAIQLCLGATAKKSGRASNLGGLIRQGSQGPAVVRVTLLNEGTDAFRPEAYGDRIKIERKISKNGTATYSMLNSQGDVVSHERKELEDILKNFNMYVDNPCCLLTQEESKKFIVGHEKDKYQFFLKATGLERVLEEIGTVADLIITSKEELSLTKDKLKRKKEVIQGIQKDLGEMMEIEKDENEIRLCLAKQFWCDVEEQRAIIDALMEKKLETEEAVAVSKAKCEELKNLTVTENIDTVTAQIDAMQKEREEIVRELDQLQSKITAKNKEASSLKVNSDNLKKAKSEHMSRLKVVQKEINDIKKAAMQDAAENERRILQQINDYKEKMSLLEGDRTQASADLDRIQTERRNIDMTLREIDRQISSLQERISQTQRNLEGLSRGGNGRMTLFGNRLEEVVRAMERERCFRSRVYGPIGMYVKLKSDCKHFGRAVEKCLFTFLKSFVVENKEDRQVLYKILQDHRIEREHPIIIQTNRPRYQINRVEGITMVADTITIENDLIFNALVDQSQLDRIALCRDEDECHETCVSARNGKDTFHQGISTAITLQGTTIKYVNGNKTSEVNPFPYKNLLAEDSAEIVHNLQETLTNLSREIEVHVRNRQDFLSQHQHIQTEGNRLNGLINQCNKEIGKLKNPLAELNNKLAEIQASSKVDSSALEFELSELRDAITDIDRQLSLMEGDLEIVNGNIKTLQSEKVAIDASKKSITSKIKREENRLEDIVNMLENRKKEISKLEKDVQLAEMKHAEACKVIQKQEDEFAKRISLAEEKTRDLVEGWDGEPLPLSRKDTKAELDKAIIRLRAKIQKHKEKEGLQDYTSATLTEKLNKAVADYEEHSQGYKALKNKIAELTDDNLKREELWSTQIRRYGKMVTKQFDVYMQKRGFSGSVSFDHENKKLLIKSQTDSYDENSKCNDVRQLSGGERSYTTLCLLMALGHVIECPFRLMDEYDVFLDQVVRKITLMELMRYALAPEQRGRQFIILTPQELSDVKVTNSVRICRIRPPERVTSRGPQQTTL